MDGSGYAFMHRDSIVAELRIDSNGTIGEIRIIDKNLMPWGTLGPDVVKRIREWWDYRCIPIKRASIDHSLRILGEPTRQSLMVRSLALNLSDHYWIRPIRDDICWDDVNLFTNRFSETVGEILCGAQSTEPEFPSPDCSTDGVVPKRWTSDRRLLKEGTKAYKQEPMNEVIASEVMNRLGVPHVQYSLVSESHSPISSCPCICTDDLEMIPARCMAYLEPLSTDGTIFEHVLKTSKMVGLEDARGFLDSMIIVDHIMANSDRHYNNFTIMRDPDTLEVKGFTPLFDTGSSLGYDCRTSDVLRCRYKGRTFKKSLDDQLMLVESFEPFDLSRLDGIGDFARKVFSRYEDFIDFERTDTIVSLIESRIDSLAGFIENPVRFRDVKSEDIET